jgi:hypothetical protein
MDTGLTSNLNRKDKLEDQGMDGKIGFLLRWILRKQSLLKWTGLIWLDTGNNDQFL